MTSPLISITQSLASNVRYSGLQAWNSLSVSSTEANASQVATQSGVLGSLYVSLSAAPGVGNSRTATIYKNGSATSMTCTISNAATTANDTVHTVSYSAGDTLSVEWNFSGTPTAAQAAFGLQADQTGQTLYTSDPLTVLGTGANTYLPLQQGVSASTTPTVPSVIPTNGTISNMYFKLSGVPGAGKSYTATLVVNGSTTALTCAISGNATTTANDTTDSVSVSAGDTAYWQVTPSGTPTGRLPAISALFTPSIDGESIHTYASSTAPSVSATNYQGIGGTGSWSSAETLRDGLISTAAVLKKLYVSLSTNPGTGKSYAYTIRANTANTSVTTTVSDAATTGNDTTNSSSSTSAGQYVGLASVPSGTPTSAVVGWGFAAYITPPVSADNGNLMMMGIG